MLLPTVAVSAYKWLVCYLLEESAAKYQAQLNSGKSAFAARNDSQAYYCRSLSLVFIEVNDNWFCHAINLSEIIC